MQKIGAFAALVAILVSVGAGAAQAQQPTPWTGPYAGIGGGMVDLQANFSDQTSIIRGDFFQGSASAGPASDVSAAVRDCSALTLVACGSEQFSAGPAFGGIGWITLGYDDEVIKNLILGTFIDLDFGGQGLKATDQFGDMWKLTPHETLYAGARAGARVADPTLLYVDTGFVRGWFNFNYNGEYSTNDAFNGIFAGIGVEQKLGGALRAKFEYRVADYMGGQVGVLQFNPFVTDTHSAVPLQQTFRIGIDYAIGQ